MIYVTVNLWSLIFDCESGQNLAALLGLKARVLTICWFQLSLQQEQLHLFIFLN